MFRSSLAKPASQPKPRIPVNDRVVNQEAMVLGFLAEKNLNFADVPDIINLAKTLAKDSEALSVLTMDRTSASYKMQYGVGKTFDDDLTVCLRNTFFSLNIDEATSKSLKKVLSILVSYFSTDDQQVVVRHLHSVSVIHANSESIHKELCKLFSEKGLPWNNLISILSDSCNVMRGSKSGFETRVRSCNAPHLLDIDGDTCHHAHNASKKVSDKFVEQMFWNVHTDFHWSPDLVEALREICFLLSIRYTMPERYVPTRWLTVYDVAIDTLRLMDAYTLFYYSFLPADERLPFMRHCVEIYSRLNVSHEVRDRIRSIQCQLRQKNMTKEGKERKKKTNQRLFHERKRMLLILHFYSSCLPLLKRYTMIFQTKEPMLHKANDEQVKLLTEFMGCFIRPDLLLNKSAKRLVELDVASPTNWLQDSDIYIGLHAKKLCATKDSVVCTFMKSVKEAYGTCGAYLQKKMPVANKLLQRVSALDPLVRGEHIAMRYMLELPSFVSNVLTENELSVYDMEVRCFHVDRELPPASTHTRLDTWWGAIFATSKFPSLSKLVAALMSCFHGPQVEGSFSHMSGIMNTSTARMNVQTYSSIQTVKYSLMASGKTATEYFNQPDFLHDPVNGHLVQNMRGARKQYGTVLANERKVREETKVELHVRKVNAASKRKSKEVSEQAAKISKIAHQRGVLTKLKAKKCAATEQKRRNPSTSGTFNSSGSSKARNISNNANNFGGIKPASVYPLQQEEFYQNIFRT